LQVLQPGAQNHSASGPWSSRVASNVPPPTRGTVSVGVGAPVVLDSVGAAASTVVAGVVAAFAVVAGTVALDASVLLVESAPQALAATTAKAAEATIVHTGRIIVRVPGVGVRRLTEP